MAHSIPTYPFGRRSVKPFNIHRKNEYGSEFITCVHAPSEGEAKEFYRRLYKTDTPDRDLEAIYVN